MAKISGIYVEIRGNSTQLRKDLATARQHVTEQATGMSNALNNALSPAQLKQNINGIVRNLNTLSQASKLTGKEFGAIGADLKDMQRLTGLSEKAFRDLQSRMIQTSAAKAQETALRNIAKAANLSAKEVSQLGKQMGVSASSIAAVNGAAKSSANSMTMLGSAAKSAIGFMSVYTVIEFGRAIMDAGLAMDSLQRSFVAVTGSQAAAAETLSFLREEAGRLGQNFYVLAPEFKNVMAAARGTAMEGENVRKMFSAIAGASTALGLSADDTHGTLRALQQMMSKGKIQAEELRGQLGERLPGALNLMAKAMGVSTAELNKMMEDGKLLADEALPKLTAEIERVYGAAAEKAALESGRAAVNRLSQAWEEFKINLFDNQAFVVAANSIRLLVTAASKAVGEWTIKEQLVAAQRELKGLEQIDGTPMATLPGFQSSLEATRKEVARLKDELLQLEKPATDAFLAMTKGLEQAENRAGDYISYLQGLDQKLEKLLQTDRDKIDATYRELSGKVKDQAALDRWYADEVAKLNEKSTKKFTDEQKKQLDAHKKAREEMRKNEAETLSAIDKWMEDYEQRQIEAVANGVAERKKLREDEAKAAADAARKIAEEQEAAAQKVMDRIQEGTADVFYDMFQDIGKGWENLWDSMKAWALRTLAELAARAATVNIVVPIMTQMTGTANAAQAVQSLTGGQGGMGGMGGMPFGSLMGGEIGVFSGVASSINTWAANTFPGVFGGATLAQAGTPLSAVVSSPSASLAAAQAGTTLNAPLVSSGTSFLGALGGVAGIGGGIYQMAQGGTGNLVSGAGTAIGGAMMFTPAAPLAPLVMIGSQILGGMFGGKKSSPKVAYKEQSASWENLSDSVTSYAGKGAKDSSRAVFDDAIKSVINDTQSQVEMVLGGLGSQYVEQLNSQVIEFGRKSEGATWGWEFKLDKSEKDIQKQLDKASAELRTKILAAASGAFTAAGQDIASGDDATKALSMLAEKSAGQFQALQDALAAGVQSGNVEAYIAHLQSFQATVQAIVQTWDAVNAAADDLVKPPTAYESAVRQANAQFDEWVGTLSALGFAQAQITEIEDKRAATLARLNAEMGPLAEAEAARASALAEAERAVETARGNLRAAYQREAAEIEATAKKWDTFAASLKKWRDDIMTGSMSPLPASSQADMAASRYSDVLNRAKLGDEEAIAELQGVAGQQLTVAKDTAKTAEDYARSALRTLSEVQSVESVATRHAEIARQQLDKLTAQISALITINDSVLSVQEAILALAAAQSAAAAAAAAAQGANSPPATGGTGPVWTGSAADAKAYADSVKAQHGVTDTSAQIIYEQAITVGASAAQVAAAIGASVEVVNKWIEDRKLPQLRGYASGGMHSGGLRLVGENGPELEVTGPSRIWNAEDTKALLSGGGDGTASEVRALRDDLRAIGRALAKNTADTAKLMQRWDGDGMPEVRVA